MNSGFAPDLTIRALSVKTRFQTVFESAGALPVESAGALPVGAFACSLDQSSADKACCERCLL